MKSKKDATDWSRIEFEYCSDDCSIREIADRHSVPESTIRKRAKSQKWVRSAQAVRTARTKPMREPLQRQPAPPPESDTDKPLDAAQIADGGRNLVARMLDELDVTTSRRGELEDMIEAATEGDEDGDRRTAMERAISLPSRANTLKTLALALKTINEASTPQGKKAARQEKAQEVANRFRPIGPPSLKAVK